MTKSLFGPLKYHGGKRYLAARIVALMPAHLHYVEPFAGGLAVLLAKEPEGVSEVANDIYKDLMNFWRVLQGGESFASFHRLCEATPFSEAEWQGAELEFLEWPEPCEEATWAEVRAWRFFVLCRQSLAGRMRSFTGVTRTRTRRGMNNEVSAWLTAVEGLSAVHERLKRVLILNRDAIDVISGQDGKDTLFYADPPYLHETRATTADYDHEMTFEQHERLLESLLVVEGKVMLSGYRSSLYDERLASWRRHDFDMANHAAGGDTKRRMTECLWCNF